MIDFVKINDLNLACIIATFGVPVKIDCINDVRTGGGRTNLFFSSSLIPQAMVKIASTMQSRSIVGLLKRGELAKNDPTHPALDCARAVMNREKVLDWVKKGTPMRLVPVDNTNKFIYVPTDLIVPAEEQFPTQNIKLVSALGVIGAPICKIVGTTNNHTFYVSRWAIDGQDAYELARQLHKGELGEHPLAWAYQTLKNRERLLDMIREKDPQLLIRRLNSPRKASAVVTPTEDKNTFARHLSAAAKHCGNF